MVRRGAVPFAAVLVILTLAVGVLPATGAEARRAPSLTKKDLRNAPIAKVCGNWKGRFKNGVLSDARDYESLRVEHLALGNLDGKRGRDGAIVVRCGTRMPYTDFVAAYVADKRGRPVLRSVTPIAAIDGTTADGGGHVSRLRITSRRIVARWDSHEADSAGDNGSLGVVPTVGRLRLRKGRLQASIERQGLRWVTDRFAATMAERDYRAARKLAPTAVVDALRGFPLSSWSERYVWYYGDFRSDNANLGWASFSDSGFQLNLRYDERTDAWSITGHYVFR